MKRILPLAGLLLSASLLQGCVVPVVAGAAATGVIANDRRSLQTMSDDQQTQYTALTRIQNDPSLTTNSHIVVVSYDHIVLLIGQVPDDSVRGRVTALVEALPKVSRVYNQLAVAPVPSPAQMSQDAWITTKVKSQMVVTKDLNAGQVKVITEDNVVYLMGIVTHDQAQLAVDVARQVNGVDRVVKLFEYTNL